MAVLGVIILIVVAVVAVTVVGQGGDPVALELPGFDIDTTAAGVFGVGAGSLLLGVLGVFLLVGGARRGRRRRKEVRSLRRGADQQPHTAGAAPVGTERAPGEDAGGPAPGAGGRGRSYERDRGSPRRRARGRDDGDDEHFASVPRD